MEQINSTEFYKCRREQGIYGIFTPINNRWYVGSARFNEDSVRIICSLGIRLRKHLYDLSKNKHANIHLQRAYDLYGLDEFKFYILQKIKEDVFIVEREQYWIDNLCNNNGYNICPIAESRHGFRHSDKTKELLRQMSTGRKHSEESRKKMSQWQIGKKTSEETKRKISESEKGKIIPLELRLRWSAARMGKKLSNDTKKAMAIAKGTLSVDDVLKIRSQQGVISAKTLAKNYGVSNVTIHNIWRRKTWKYI